MSMLLVLGKIVEYGNFCSLDDDIIQVRWLIVKLFMLPHTWSAFYLAAYDSCLG
jgi:alpha-N-acetylglucosamine transferase